MAPTPERRARSRKGVPPGRIQRTADFRVALRIFERHVEQAARRHGLTPQRFFLLLQIEGASAGGRSVGIGEIADRLQLSANGVTELVARAADAGLVTRNQSPEDARAVHVLLTPEGRSRLEDVVLETDRYRNDLRHAFDSLIERFEAVR
jgi:DNA-binding MarR family transcriptional regulator